MQFVYYCSGHGYGHATRVSAFASHLLRLSPKPIVHIVSSAPKHVFADSIALGAQYRHANIDPVIVQPLAYRVDRTRSIEVLKAFLEETPQKIEDEAQWLRAIGADCVLSDAAFLGCAAANVAGIPSVLVTNFTFDSVYSYLATLLVDEQNVEDVASQTLGVHSPSHKQLAPDTPIPLEEVEPLVQTLWEGYRCADLLLRLPGAIPIPSFASHPSLPSPDWVNIETRRFTQDVFDHLLQHTSDYTLLEQIPFPDVYPPKTIPRSVVSAPLLVRSPNPDVYAPEGRRRILDTIGVPQRQQSNPDTKILIVSFGGQIFHKPPSRTHSRTPSSASTPNATSTHHVLGPSQHINGVQQLSSKDVLDSRRTMPTEPENAGAGVEALTTALHSRLQEKPKLGSLRLRPPLSRKQSLLMIPGAPAASVPSSPLATTIPAFPSVIPPTPKLDKLASDPFEHAVDDSEQFKDEVFGTLLPDESWIAVVCGVSKDWAMEDGEDLPENFYVAPKDIYMPDLTAVADVLLGKLGYGTVSECVDSCTPFVYVPRPLFIEEHGLRLLLEQEGVGIELSRQSYESGEWASAVGQAYQKGKEAKTKKRAEGETGKRTQEGKEMAGNLIQWVERWKTGCEAPSEV